MLNNNLLKGEIMKNQNKKVDELINFFETERQKATSYFFLHKDDLKFDFSTSLSLTAVFIALSATLLSLNISLGLFILLGSLIIIIVNLFWYIHYSRNEYKDYIKKSISYDVIINFLQSLKICEEKVDLTPLISKIKQLHRDELILTIKNYDEIWINGVIHSLDEINNEIIQANKD